MAAITLDDWYEAFYTLQRRGSRFFLSKLNPNGLARTRSTFGDEALTVAHWWIVPAIRQRWNQLITGHPDLRYEDYLMQRYWNGRQGLRLLSLGCGIASHERYLARYGQFAEIHCVDLSAPMIRAAEQKAQAEGLRNTRFEVADIHTLKLPPQRYDGVLFHASLHHFAQLDHLIGTRLPQVLKPEGLLIVNEYVGPNRLQWSEAQLQAANQALRELLPAEYRQYFRSRLTKQQISGPGRWRMQLSDPSEAVESERILPLLRQHFEPLEEKPYGGNLLVPLLKHIAHHFVPETDTNQRLLAELFRREDQLLQQEPSLMLFGIYGQQSDTKN